MSEPEQPTLAPCPWCKAIPEPSGHYYEVLHTSDCFFAERDSDNARQIIVKAQVERWNTRALSSASDAQLAELVRSREAELARLLKVEVKIADEYFDGANLLLEGILSLQAALAQAEAEKEALREAIVSLTRYDINVNGIGISPRKGGELLCRDDVLALLTAEGKPHAT